MIGVVSIGANLFIIGMALFGALSLMGLLLYLVLLLMEYIVANSEQLD